MVLGGDRDWFPPPTLEPRMTLEGHYVADPEVAPTVNGRRQVKAVLRVKFRLCRVAHGIFRVE